MRVKLPRGLLGRRRYVSFRLIPRGEEGFPPRDRVEGALEEAAARLFGALGSADLDLSLKFYSQRTGSGVLRTDNRSLGEALTVLLTAASLVGPFTVEVGAVSGTLRGLSRRSRSRTKTL